ncbi:MAG: putative LPS assembly protein LptD [Fidelibacterota bacterium]
MKNILLCFSFLIVILTAQDRLRLIHADELENVTDKNGNATQFLRGNVKFRKGIAILTSDRAYYRQANNSATFVHNVRMEKNEQVLTADSLHMDTERDILTGYGRIEFRDPDYQLTSDTLEYYMEIDSGSASGSVQFIQKKQTITARRITYRKKEELNAASYTARGNVVIDEEGRRATCGRSIYDATTESSILFDEPVITQEDRIISGTEIFLTYEDEILEHLSIPDEAHIIYPSRGKLRSPADTTNSEETYSPVEFQDDMTGKRLEAFLVEGKLDSVRLEGMATTLYHLFEDSVYQGLNIASGDTIMLAFTSDSAQNTTLETIKVIGGARGEYQPDEASENINDLIIYRAEMLDYIIPKELTTLRNKARIDYQDLQLESGFVAVSWDENLMHALPSPAIDNDSIPQPDDLPVLKQKGHNPMVGTSLTYNLSTGRGRVLHGKTHLDDGYYRGSEIRNRDENTYFVTQSAYTTCDLDPSPHFHFQSQKMKMISEDKIIVKPIILYLGGVPLFGLPFGVFPDQGGRRHSGWIMPTYGENATQGRYLKKLGYFWAVNEYVNSQILFDFYDEKGILLQSRNSYYKRYGFNGSFNFRYNRMIATRDIKDIFERPSSESWSLVWHHQQQMRYNQSFNVDASYYSDNKFNRKLGVDRSTRLNQTANSRANYSKRWPKLGLSLSASVSENRNLMAEAKTHKSSGVDSIYYEDPVREGQRINETNSVLPSLTFYKGRSQLSGGAGKGGAIYWSYNSTLKNRQTGFYESVYDTTYIDSIGMDSLGNAILDTTDTYSWQNLDFRQDNSWSHNISLSGSFRLLRHVAIQPSLNIREEWITRYFNADTVDSLGKALDKREVEGFRARHTGSLSVSANTKLYGLFPVKIGPLLALRHTLTPSIGFSYQPDYSKPIFGYDLGYFKTITDSAGREHLFDPFSGSVIGATSTREAKKLNFSIKNVLQAKVLSGGEEKKINNLLTWNMNSSYNFSAEQFKLANLRSSIRAKLAGKLNLDISMTHDFYDVHRDNGELIRVDELRINRWGLPSPRLTNMSASTGFRFVGGRWASREETELVTETDTTVTDTGEIDLSEAREKPLSKTNRKPISGGKLWNATLSLRYSANRFDPNNRQDKFWGHLGLDLQVTKFWRIRYSARFDLLERKLVSHDFNIYRDLHCWELSFNWTPGGLGQGFYLKVNVKSPTLDDLKVESRGGRWNLPYF